MLTPLGILWNPVSGIHFHWHSYQLILQFLVLLQTVSSDEINPVIRSLPISSPGPDGITANILICLASKHLGVVLSIINCSLEYSSVPRSWNLKMILTKKVTFMAFEIDNNTNIALSLAVVNLI